jgi:antitoxin (DNA-binding transcriptional repressor) of toxin-antitoxin stability system
MGNAKRKKIPRDVPTKKGHRERPTHTSRERSVSATEAARSFSELLDRIAYRGESFIVERGGEPVCEMSNVRPLRFTGADLLSLLHSLPKPDPGYWEALAEATEQRETVPESLWES